MQGIIARRLINKRLLVPITSFRNLATKFAASHEYIKLDGDVGTVGITEHAAKALGDVVFVDLPSIGSKYSAGDSFGSVESVKAASDVYAPVSGEVVAINEALTENPGTVNDSPLEKGWFIKLKVDGEGKVQFNKLLSESDYQKKCEDEAH